MCQGWGWQSLPYIGSESTLMWQYGILKISFSKFCPVEPKCTETDLKKTHNCSIWGQLLTWLDSETVVVPRVAPVYVPGLQAAHDSRSVWSECITFSTQTRPPRVHRQHPRPVVHTQSLYPLFSFVIYLFKVGLKSISSFYTAELPIPDIWYLHINYRLSKLNTLNTSCQTFILSPCLFFIPV